MLKPGGEPSAMTAPSGDAKKLAFGWPSLLPDGRAMIVSRRAVRREDDFALVRSVDGADVYQEVPFQSSYSAGHLVFPRSNQLYAQKFDVERRQLAGDPVSLGVPVANAGELAYPFSVSAGGTLLVLTEMPSTLSQFTSLDQQGRRLGTVGPEGEYGGFDVTDRGDRVVANGINSSWSLWVLESGRSAARRLTFDDQLDVDPNVTADGSVYFVRRASDGELFRIRIDGGAEQRVRGSPFFSLDDIAEDEIGRASCRERV